MKALKKSSYFTKVEDKYVFKISTAFWHLLIGILSLAAIVGIAIFLWSLIPPIKKHVEVVPYPSHPIYPPVKKVSIADLHLTDEKLTPSVVEVVDTAIVVQQKKEVPVEEYDLDKPAYDIALAEIRKIIGEEQWRPGTWIITNQTGWELYHSDQYRSWVPTGNSIEDYLENIYGIVKSKKFAEKKRTLDAVAKIVKVFPSDSRGKSVEYISSFINSNWVDMKLHDSVCTIVSNGIKTFNGKASPTALQDIIRFSYNNPDDIFEFLPFALKTCLHVPDSLRSSLFLGLTTSYYNHFYKNMAIQKDATEQFVELIPQLHGYDPVKAMKKFYSVYNQKNSQRSEEIALMNNEYEAKINAIVSDSIRQAMQNEYNYQVKQNKKSDLRWRSLLLIGGGFIAIALLGTILTLLSIQRILKRMEGKSENITT